MDPVRIVAVSYLNTYPFVYGLLESGKLKNARLELEVPSVCAAKLKSGEADIALVPVGAISDFDYVTFVSDYCIGAIKEVRTVLLLSKKPLREIKTIQLDPDSRTSVLLVRILASKYWKINPEWADITSWDDPEEDYDAVVAIGDKTFELRKKYPYVYDLAAEWIRHTSYPFVFAAWLAVKKQPEKLIRDLNEALTFGIKRKKEALRFFSDNLPTSMEEALEYLEENISYTFDLKKKKGLEQFMKLSRKIR